MDRNSILNIFRNCTFENLNSENFEFLVLENLPMNFCYKYYYGASKLVFIPTGEKYVIKIPFIGYDDNEFDGLNADDARYWDYCFTELLTYNAAKKKKIGRAFAKIKFIGMVNNHPIYIQERAETYEYRKQYKDKKKNLESSISHTYKIISEHNYRVVNLDWSTDAYNYYGEKQFNKLMKFINPIGDLHEDNIGYIGTRPVLIDYSDFYS